MKKAISGILVIIMMISLTCCSNIESISGNSAKTYGEYVYSLIDAKLKGDYDKYIELTGSDEQAVTELYNESMVTLADSFIEIYGLKTDSEDIYDRMLDLVAELCSKTQYQTSDASKVGGAYIVTVTMKPLDFIPRTRDAYNSFIVSWTERYHAGELSNLTIEEYDMQFDEELMDILEDSLDKTSGQEAITYEVVIQFSDDTYYVDDEDFMNIQTSLFVQ